MAPAVALRPPWFPAPGAAAHNKSTNMIVDKCMLLKVKDLIVFTIN